MSHSFTNIWIHAVCGTKFREELILPEYEAMIHAHMETELGKIQCPVKAINGTADHVHVLFKQNPKIAIIDILKQIKGNTSNWINTEDFFNYKFAWQTGYSAFSVSVSQLQNVVTYIKNQKEHHKKQSFKEEYEFLLQTHGLDIRGIWEDSSGNG